MSQGFLYLIIHSCIHWVSGKVECAIWFSQSRVREYFGIPKVKPAQAGVEYNFFPGAKTPQTTRKSSPRSEKMKSSDEMERDIREKVEREVREKIAKEVEEKVRREMSEKVGKSKE